VTDIMANEPLLIGTQSVRNLDAEALLRRVQELELPDADLDGRLFALLRSYKYPLDRHGYVAWQALGRKSPNNYSGSTDAALEFSRSMLPPARIEIISEPEGHTTVKLYGRTTRPDGSPCYFSSQTKSSSTVKAILVGVLAVKMAYDI
jgi:hypothetical protein